MNTLRIDLTNILTRRYKMWTLKREGKEVRTVVSTLPYEVIEREARKVGVAVAEFLEIYEAEYLYNGFEGLHVRFVRADSK